MPEDKSHQLLTVAEVAKRLRVSHRSVYSLVREGALRATKISARGTRIEAREIERFIRDASDGSAS